MMTQSPEHDCILTSLDEETQVLVYLAAMVAGGTESEIRAALTTALDCVRAGWVEELLLQTYLFCGFPRALNATREWRRISGLSAAPGDEGVVYDAAAWLERGLDTCATVYGKSFDRLRENIRELHPALDSWMIIEGYGKVLGREGLDLARRELCIIASCAVDAQDRQLHSHLRGALNAGVAAAVVAKVLDMIPLISAEERLQYQALWSRVQGKESSVVHGNSVSR